MMLVCPLALAQQGGGATPGFKALALPNPSRSCKFAIQLADAKYPPPRLKNTRLCRKNLNRWSKMGLQISVWTL